MKQKIGVVRAPTKLDNRALQELYDKLNEIILALNKNSSTEGKTKGNEGRMRLEKTINGEYKVLFKFEDGWVETSALTIREN